MPAAYDRPMAAHLGRAWIGPSLALALALGGSAQAQPAPAARPAPAAPAADADAALAKLLARTDAVAREVSKIRGLRLVRPIPNEVVDRDELRRRLLAMASEDKAKAETAAAAIALARWGLIPLDTDYEALMVDVMTEQLAGYYDTDTKRLTISKSAGADAQWAELVLAHEIDHGLQDQAFDLKKFEDLPDAEGDARMARRALVEGDGVALMIELLVLRNGGKVPWGNPRVADALVEAMAEPGDGTIDRAPIAIREAMLFPYRAGFAFVAALRRRQPWSAVDAAFARPPRSTEQIMHPDRYVSDEKPIPIELDPVTSLRGYARIDESVWGELGFQLFLRSHGIDAAIAARAAAGWGGDRSVVLARPGDPRRERAVGIARSEWDSEPDAIEAAESAVKAVDANTTGAVLELSENRTRWFGLDGRLSWVERRGTSLVIVIGAPAWAAKSLAAEVWTTSRIAKPAPAKPAPKKR